LHTLDNKIATLHTGGHAAAQKGISWIVPYVHSLIEVYKTYKGCLKSDEVTGNYGHKQLTCLGMDPNQSAAMICLLPSIFGGYPSLPFNEYIFRGHPDPRTGGLWSLTILANASLTARQILHYIKSLRSRDVDARQSKEGKRYIDFSSQTRLSMILDPTTLHIQEVGKAHALVRDALQQSSGSQVKNKAIKEICGAGSEQIKNKIIEWLGTSNPFIPRVLNTVFKITPSGAREQFHGTFGSLKTLRTLLGGESLDQLESDIINRERTCVLQLAHVQKQIIRQPISMPELGCHTTFCQKWRYSSRQTCTWGHYSLPRTFHDSHLNPTTNN
jgi:hypothetical protein